MTEHDGGSEGVSWLDVTASAAGINAAFGKLGGEGGDSFIRKFRETVGGGKLSAELMAGLDDTSAASLAGARVGQAFGSAIGAPIRLVREAFEGLTRSGTESAETISRQYNAVSESVRKAEASVKSLNAEAKAASASGGAFDSTKILAATTELERYRKEQTNLADQLRASDEAAKGAGGSFEHLSFVSGAMGGLVVAGTQLAVQGLGDMFEAAENVAEKILDIGDVMEQVNRVLVADTTASGDALSGLKEIVNQVSEGTSQSFQNIAGVTAVLSQRSGLAGDELKSLVSDVEQLGDITGKALDPAKFAAAASALNVPASQWDSFLTKLEGMARLASIPLSDLVNTLGQNAAALSAFNVPAEAAAALLTQMTASGIPAAQAMRALRGVVADAHKTHQTFADDLRNIVQGVEDAHKSGNALAEDSWLEKLGPQAAVLKTAIDDGVLSVASLNSVLGDVPTTPISELHEQTETLSDRLAELGHTVSVDLAPLGETLTEHLAEPLKRIGDWVGAHQGEIIGWLTGIGVAAIEVGSEIGGVLGTMTQAIGAVQEAYGYLKDDDAAKTAGQHLEDLGQKLSDAAGNSDEATDAFKRLMAAAGKPVDITPHPTGPGGVGEPPKDPASLFNIPEGGIKVPVTPVPGKLETSGQQSSSGAVDSGGDGDFLDPFGITDFGGTEALDPWGIATPDALDPFQIFHGDPNFRDRVKDMPPGTGGRGWRPPPTPPAPSTAAPAAAAPPFQPLTPSQFQIGGAPATPPDLKTLLGVAPSGFKIPAQIDFKPAATLEPNDLFGKSGVPSHYFGDVPHASPGVLLPTGFDIHDGETQSVSALMDSIGIPSELQGDGGVTIPASFSVPTGIPGAPSGVPGAGGSTGGGGTGPNWQAIAGAESGGNWQITYGQGPDVTGGLQIATETWLSHGGAAFAPKAYQATEEQQISIAQKILDDPSQGPTAWPTTFRDHPEWFANGSSGAPAGGGGDGTYAGIGATDNASTANPQYGGIPNAPSGQGQDVLAYMKSVMDQFNQQTGAHLNITADYPGGPHGHPDDGADHSVRRALDIHGTQAEMDAFAQMWASNPALLAATRQLIHNDPNNPDIGTNDNIIGGHRTSGYQTYKDWMSGHIDHDHIALQYIPGVAGATSPASNVVPADYSSGGLGVPTTTFVDRITQLGTPGNPQSPAPITPGSNFNAVPPPPNIPTVPQGTPNSIDTPFGSFSHSWDLPDKGASMSPETRVKLDEWLNSYASALEAATNATDEVTKADQRVADLLQAKNDADAAVLPGDPETTKAAQTADRQYADAVTDAARARRHQTDEQNRQNLEAEKPAPWETTKSSKEKPDKDAETLGKGLVKGIFQEFGFPDVFGKPFSDWGITKLLAGGAGYGLNLLQNMGSAGPIGGGSAPAASGGSVAAGGALGVIGSLFPGLIPPAATQGTPAFTPGAWNVGGAPAPASDTPAGVGSSSPAVIPVGAATGPGSTTNNSLNVQVNHGGFNPSPQVRDTIKSIAGTTSAPAMSGGAGIPT